MIDLAAAKSHCRVDHDEDDAAITAMIAAASGHFESVGVDMSAAPLPAAVTHAVLMLVAHFYQHREAVSHTQTAATQIGVDRLIQPYREVSL
ncbi:head-tail connector protein [Bosea vaviloviae]|uniref:Phage gp6-like head-tail connector protein n=1 Tax=Bosea vaviloviae TaxID=1526658 RepID=A0A0N1F4N7_9HYPH|nr:head-tail connector protein [Bosea vaviloviae]KPH80565.1 hypothetical protein AE618_12410 [Bosea vaviloviae]